MVAGPPVPLITPYDLGDAAAAEGEWPVYTGGSVPWEWRSPITIGRQFPVQFLAGGAAIHRWQNMPAAPTFLLGSHTHVTRADLTQYSQARFIVNKQGVAAFTGAQLALRYKTGAFSTSALGYGTIGTGIVQVAIDTTNALLDTGWIDLAAGAKADVVLAVIGFNGDGVVDPDFGEIVAHFR